MDGRTNASPSLTPQRLAVSVKFFLDMALSSREVLCSHREDREAIPVIVQAAQDRLLGHVEVGFLKMGFAARLHLAPFGLQIAVGLGKGGRLLIKRQGLIPPLEAGLLEAVEVADVLNPRAH